MALRYGAPKTGTQVVGTRVIGDGAIDRMLHERNNDLPLLTDFETETNYDTAVAGKSSPLLSSALVRFKAAGTAAVLRDLQSKVRERVSVLDFDRNANDGTTDATSGIRAAISAMVDAGGGDILLPGGAYLTTEAIEVNDHNIRLIGEGPYRTYFTKLPSSSHKYLIVNDLQDDAGWDTSQNNRLVSAATVGDMTLSLQAGKGANFTAGTHCVLISDATIEGGASVTAKRAEFVYVYSVSGDTLTLGRPIRYTYTVGQNAEVRNIRKFLTGFELSGIGFDGADYAYSGSPQTGNVIECEWALRPVFRNIAAWQTPNVFLQLSQCIQARVERLASFDGMSNGFLDFADGFSYAVAELGLNEGMTAVQLTGDCVRHTYTTSESPLGYGIPTGSVIGDSTALNSRGAGFDTHPGGADISFVNCTTVGSLHHGFQARCMRTSFSGCVAMDCAAVGFYISDDSTGAYLSNCRSLRTNTNTVLSTDWTERGSFYDDGEKTTIDGFTVQTCGGPGLEIADDADFGNYRNGIIRDPAQLAATNTRGVLAISSGPTIFECRDVLVHDTLGNVTNAFQLDAASFTDVRVIACRGIGYSASLIGGTNTAVRTILSQGAHQIGMGRRDNSLTIASGAIDIEDVASPYLGIAGEGGLADNLDTINGGQEGTVIVLERNAADITLRDSSVSGGNIELAGATSFTMDGNDDGICLRKKSDTWRECWRADV